MSVYQDFWGNAQNYAQLGRVYPAEIGQPTISQSQLDPKIFQHLLKGQPVYSGNKPLVVCGGVITECEDLDEAQRVAEREAHAKSTDAYILKPVKLVAPKRETVTTDLP